MLALMFITGALADGVNNAQGKGLFQFALSSNTKESQDKEKQRVEKLQEELINIQVFIQSNFQELASFYNLLLAEISKGNRKT